MEKRKRTAAPGAAPGRAARLPEQGAASPTVQRLQAHLVMVREDMRRISGRLDEATREFAAADKASQAVPEELRVAKAPPQRGARRLDAVMEARLAALVRSTRAAVVTWTPEGRIVDWNDGAARLFGYAADDIVGRHVDLLAMLGERRELSGDRAAIDGVYDRELEMRHKDGHAVHVAWTVAAVCDAEGRVIGAAGVGADVGDHARLERRVAQMADRQRQALGRELHDTLGQQLTAIGLLASALKARAAANEGLTEVSEKIERAIETAKGQLRAIVKGLAPVEIDARGLAVALEELAEETKRGFGIDCRFESPRAPTTEDHFTANQLYLIAREAVHNAVKHASPRSIVIRLEATDGLPRLSVTDDGVGIAWTDEKRGDASMGLPIMRYRCRVIGGDLRVGRGEAGGTVVACNCRRAPAEPADSDA